MSSKRRRKKARVPGLIITIILLLLVAEFVGLLAVTKLLPIYLLFAVGIVFMTCVLLVAMLTGNFRKKVRFIIGAILGVLLLVILLLGNLYVMSTYNTLNKISGVNTQTSQIGVYVLKDDSAQSIEDAKSYTFGTLSNLDTENTQAAVKQIEERTGQSVKTQEENGVTKLVDSLLDGSCDAIILNHAYLPVLEDMEGYADIEDKIRELDLLSVDVEIKTDDTASSDDTAKQIRIILSVCISAVLIPEAVRSLIREAMSISLQRSIQIPSRCCLCLHRVIILYPCLFPMVYRIS